MNVINEQKAKLVDLIDELSLSTKEFKMNLENNKEVLKTISGKEALLKLIDKQVNNKNENRLHSGFSIFDYYANGLINGNLYVIAGKSGTGKTTFIINMINNIIQTLKDNETILFISLETSAHQIIKKFFNIFLNSINFNNFESLSTNELGEVLKDNTRLFNQFNKLTIIDDFNFKCSEIQDIIKDIEQKQNKKVKGVFIDHIQIMKHSYQSLGKREEINRIMSDLKGYAKELDLPIVALSQLTRETKTDIIEKDKFDIRKPKLSQLKESSAIEECADVIALLYLANALNPFYDILHISLDKNREGQRETQKLEFYKSSSVIKPLI
ncbi:gas vesicle protein GvpD [Mycoplasmopsis gallinacea]|uniref:Repb n=1 Tax=Mycoplasmopsis gallinacea TaxID=29556 RepID=A0A449A2D6_9BACT|nr:gas vesicle protein GvpD [Mycoplasmopsis gallinacea]VEU58399.1 repb [Mycoplasmopsis gallinacea]